MEQISKEQALSILIQATQQGKYTLAEADLIKQSMQILGQVLQQFDKLSVVQKEVIEEPKELVN